MLNTEAVGSLSSLALWDNWLLRGQGTIEELVVTACSVALDMEPKGLLLFVARTACIRTLKVVGATGDLELIGPLSAIALD